MKIQILNLRIQRVRTLKCWKLRNTAVSYLTSSSILRAAISYLRVFSLPRKEKGSVAILTLYSDGHDLAV